MPSAKGAGKRAALVGAGRMGLAMASGWMRDLAAAGLSQLDIVEPTPSDDVRQMATGAVRLNAAVGEACQLAVTILDDAGGLGSGRDLDVEARRLHALVDGAAIHGLWTEDAAESLRVVVGHLDDLAHPAD